MGGEVCFGGHQKMLFAVDGAGRASAAREIAVTRADEINPAGHPEVIVCAGPPSCDLQDEKAVEAANAGCPKCKRIVVHPDGTETTYRLKPN